MPKLKVLILQSSQRVRSLELNTTRENILSWFGSTFPERQTGGQSKTHGECCLRGAMRHEEVWLFDTDAAVMEMLLVFPLRAEILTGTWICSAALSLSPTSLTVFAPQLWHRGIAVSYSGNLSLSTGHRAGWPRRPQAPPSVLANWVSYIKHIRQRSPKHTCHVLSSRFPFSQIVTDMYNLQKFKKWPSKQYVMLVTMAQFQRCSKMLAPVFMSFCVNYPPVVRLIQSLTQLQCNFSFKQ